MEFEIWLAAWNTAAMRMALLVPAIALLGGCATVEHRQSRLMDEIESRVQLPEGAAPLSSYGRFYTSLEPTRVTGIYVLPSDPKQTLAFCRELGPTGESCTTYDSDKIGAGERRWISGSPNLMNITDQGCSRISVTYDTVSGVVEAYCGGTA